LSITRASIRKNRLNFAESLQAVVLKVYEAVAESPFGEDILGMGWVFFDLLAKIGYIKAQVVGFVPVLVSPDFGQ
jgi:hypothetical protein